MRAGASWRMPARRWPGARYPAQRVHLIRRLDFDDKSGAGTPPVLMDTNMNATFTGIPRALLAILGPLVALGLLLSMQGCSTPASAGTSVTGPTPASALGVSRSFATRRRSRWPITMSCWPCRC